MGDGRADKKPADTAKAPAVPPKKPAPAPKKPDAPKQSNTLVGGRKDESEQSAGAGPQPLEGRTARTGVDGMVNEGLDHFDPEQLPQGQRPVSNGEHRAGLIAGIKGMRDGLFGAIAVGAELAHHSAAERDKPPHIEPSRLLAMLGEATSVVLAGSNAAIALWLANEVVSAGAKPEVEFAKNAIKELIKDSIHSVLAPKASSPKDLVPGLRENFFHTVSGEILDRGQTLEQEWSRYSDRLSSLSDEQLEQAHAHAVASVRASELASRVMDRTLVGWTNFLAMVDNGHKGWDFWEKNGGNGAVPSKDASKAPSKVEEDPSHGNIDPARTGNLVSSHGDPSAVPGMQSYASDIAPSTGVLEVFCDWDGNLSNEYGMKIANVGPLVRARLITFGRVGSLAVNKNIHIVMSDERVGSGRVHASILVTADGYIRKVTWDVPGGSQGARVAKVVERVQNLPLSLLGE